jgi:hypothetical protein
MSESLKQMSELIQETLGQLGPKYAKPEARELVLSTGLVESRFKYIKQIGTWVASGYFQVESATAVDNCMSYLKFRPELARRCAKASETSISLWESGDHKRWKRILTYNIACGIIHCRIKYWRSPLPIGPDTHSMAKIWKQVYNTSKGAGKIEDYLEIVGKHI